MGALFPILNGIPLPVEAVGMILLGIVVFAVTRKQQVKNRLYTHEIPIFLVTAGVGVFIPGGYALFLAMTYVCWRIFQEATYSLCPPCWDKFGQSIRWLWRKTLGRT